MPLASPLNRQWERLIYSVCGNSNSAIRDAMFAEGGGVAVVSAVSPDTMRYSVSNHSVSDCEPWISGFAFRFIDGDRRRTNLGFLNEPLEDLVTLSRTSSVGTFHFVEARQFATAALTRDGMAMFSPFGLLPAVPSPSAVGVVGNSVYWMNSGRLLKWTWPVRELFRHVVDNIGDLPPESISAGRGGRPRFSGVEIDAADDVIEGASSPYR